MPRSSGYTYDPKTGKWTKSSNNGSSSSSSSSSSSNNTGTGSENLTSSSSNKNSSTGATEKKYNTIEINTLEGTLNFIVTKATIKLKAGDTVSIKGIGKYLSGKYYVKEIETLDNYVLDENTYEAELVYKDQYTPTIFYSKAILNILKTGKIF